MRWSLLTALLKYTRRVQPVHRRKALEEEKQYGSLLWSHTAAGNIDDTLHPAGQAQERVTLTLWSHFFLCLCL